VIHFLCTLVDVEIHEFKCPPKICYRETTNIHVFENSYITFNGWHWNPLIQMSTNSKFRRETVKVHDHDMKRNQPIVCTCCTYQNAALDDFRACN